MWKWLKSWLKHEEVSLTPELIDLRMTTQQLKTVADRLKDTQAKMTEQVDRLSGVANDGSE